MKRTVFMCDRCGLEISGNPAVIAVSARDAETCDLIDPEDDTLEGLDFCEQCADKIKRFAKGGMKTNWEFDRAVTDMVNSASPETDVSEEARDEPADAPDLPEEDIDEKEEIEKLIAEVFAETEAVPKRKTKKAQVWELRQQGMRPKDIALKLNIPPGMVSQYIYQCKKEQKAE